MEQAARPVTSAIRMALRTIGQKYVAVTMFVLLDWASPWPCVLTVLPTPCFPDLLVPSPTGHSICPLWARFYAARNNECQLGSLGPGKQGQLSIASVVIATRQPCVPGSMIAGRGMMAFQRSISNGIFLDTASSLLIK